MTVPPLPASPCLRVRLDFLNEDGFDAGSRFFLSYAGAAPTPGNCATIAGDIATAWASDMAALSNTGWTLTEIDVLDIASHTGASGQWTGSHAGTAGGGNLPASAATNVEFGIARRYRGGKPRMFLPAPGTDALNTAAQWTTAYQTAVNTGVAAFFTAVEAISVGAVGALGHVNVSYYQGFTNHTNTSGRERAVPTYRDVALVDVVNGYSAKLMIGSQRRRRVATTP